MLRLGLRAPDRFEALRLYTVGVLSLRLDERGAARTASATLGAIARTRSGDWFVNAADAELRARLARTEGHDADALRILDEIETGPVPLGVINVTPFFAFAHMRYLRGEILADLGREAEALEWFGGLGKLSVPESAYRPLAHLRIARIHDALGNHMRAARHYRRFVDLWEGGDPSTRRLVEQARRRLADLDRSS